MPQGTVKKIIDGKGFGFIDGIRGDVFFHMSAVQKTSFNQLYEGQSVEYEEEGGPKGPRATIVTPSDA